MSHVKVMMVKHDKREIEQLKHVFEDMPDYEYIGCCEKGDEAVKKIAEDKPDIVIADEVIPGTDITDMVEGVSGNKNLKCQICALFIEAAQKLSGLCIFDDR